MNEYKRRGGGEGRGRKEGVQDERKNEGRVLHTLRFDYNLTRCSRNCTRSSRADNGRSLNDIESSLPAEAGAKEAVIDQAILDRTAKFLSTHTVELSLPEDVSRSFDEGKQRYSFIH